MDASSMVFRSSRVMAHSLSLESRARIQATLSQRRILARKTGYDRSWDANHQCKTGGIPGVIASDLPVSGLTAAAPLSVIGVKSGDTLLIGGAAGGVGTFAVQLAKLAGATDIGTGSEDSSSR